MLTPKLETTNPMIGGLYVQTGAQQLVFPLKHTEVQAKIAGNVSRVEVTQTFENPFTEPLEAVYVFPLPDEAAVDDMEIKIDDALGRQRIIKGSIKKREQAIAVYERAKQQGRTAGLLEQERDNIFTQSLANIKPGEQIDVTIRYTDSLKFEGGDYEFVFPMVVGPRFICGDLIDESGDTDAVPDASRITPSIIPPNMRSLLAPPEERSRHDISVTLEIDAGLPISGVRSTSHQLHVERDGEIVRVKLGGEDTIPNKDLIVRYQVVSDNTQATVLTQSDERGSHFAVYLIPALDYREDEIVPKDVVFLIDTSGSQMGDPLHKSQELMRRFIKGLNPDDTFTILDFSDVTTQLSPKPLANTFQNRKKAIQYIDHLQANGGTYLLNGIRAVLNFPAAAEGRLRSIVLLTDGYIGNENEILAEVQRQLKPGNRLYSFGVGSSPNRFLLNRLAEIGRGTCQIVRHDQPTEEVAEKFFRQINNPVLTNIQVSWEGTGEAMIYPSTPPDLFAEQPLVLFGRISSCNKSKVGKSNVERSQEQPATRPNLQPITHSGTLRITGMTAGGKCYEQTFNLTFEEVGNPAIAQLWGRARIKDLMNQMFSCEKKAQLESVTEIALTYRLLSQYTAFVAVSEEVRVDAEGKSISVQVPVEMAEGVSYKGIFAGSASGVRYATMSELARPMMLRSAQPVFKSSASPAHSANRGGFIGNLLGGLVKRQSKPDNYQSPSHPTAEASESFNINLINPGRIQEVAEDQSLPTSTASYHSLQVVGVTGLDEVATASLTKHLQQLDLPYGLSGEIVFEFPVRMGRVVRVVLDEEASTLKESLVIERIKRSLQAWRVFTSVIGTVRLTLRIHT
jgi:Ca-activated chloride channel homolog